MRPFVGRQREPRLAHQGACQRRGAMNELGAALRRVSKFVDRQPVGAGGFLIDSLISKSRKPEAPWSRKSGSHGARRWREVDSNPRSPLREEREYEISREDREIASRATAAWRGFVRPVHQLPGRWAILRNLTLDDLRLAARDLGRRTSRAASRARNPVCRQRMGRPLRAT